VRAGESHDSLQALNIWRRKQSSANRSPPVDSLFHGKIQGNLPISGLSRGNSEPYPNNGTRCLAPHELRPQVQILGRIYSRTYQGGTEKTRLRRCWDVAPRLLNGCRNQATTIDGDLMEPLLSGGDRVLIDTSQRVPVPPGIFAIWDGIGLVAKRIEHEPNSDPAMVVIKSVNPEYQTYQRMAEEVHIVGRVVWTSRRL
jgi:hypothetical protein